MTRHHFTARYCARGLFAASLATSLAMPLAAFAAAGDAPDVEASDGTAISAETVAKFHNPWAMTFLPDGSMLVTEQRGQLVHVSRDGEKTDVANMFEVAYGGQGGLGDVILDPDFAENRHIYLSYAESLDDGATRGAAVVRARLAMNNGKPALEDITKLWRQEPYRSGKGHFSHRLAFAPDNAKHPGDLFITSGERQRQDPAQEMDSNLGKVIRIKPDGSIPSDNPFSNDGDIAKQFYTVGNRNMLGIAFDADGTLWTHEMGPEHGDELNKIEAGDNYGWPVVPDGDNYSGVPIPDHDTRPEFNAPEISWVPSIGPAGFVIYNGDMFEGWQGDGFIGGLVAKAIVRVTLDGENSEEVARYGWDKRIRELEQGPDGALWVLEDKAKGAGDDTMDARLIRLTPSAEES